MELFTERLKLKDIMPEKAKDIAKEYNLKENEIEFVRKNNPLNPDDIKIEDGERAAIRYINTADLDRDGEIVMPDGGLMKDYQKNPTVLYSHDYKGLPIGKDIWIKLVKGKGWLAKTIYAKHQLADDVYNLVKEKFLNTSSIGFIPLESLTSGSKGWDKVKEKLVKEWSILGETVDQSKKIITKWILLEHSDVPLASNINALNIAVGKGFEIKSKQLFDDLKIEIIDEKKEEKIEIATKPEETENYIHIRVRDPGDFQEDSFRTIDIDKGKGIKAVIGRLKGETTTTVQKYMFDKSKGWTMASAQAWVNDHKKEYENIEEKGVIPFKETSKAPEDEAWDAGKEVGEADVSDLKIMCAWFDSENPDLKTAYKLPHHKASGHAVVWRAVAAAMAALLGARGGVDIPASDKSGVYNHLAKHYKQFDKEPPELKDYEEAELKELFPEEEKDKKENNSIIELATKYGILFAEKNNLENEIKLRNTAIGELETKIGEIELKQGAVLNSKNKQSLKNAQKLNQDAQTLIQGVLDSAEPAQEGKEIIIEIEEEKKEKKDELDIDINDIKDIINSAIKAQINNVTDSLKEEMNNNFKRITGKVM